MSRPSAVSLRARKEERQYELNRMSVLAADMGLQRQQLLKALEDDFIELVTKRSHRVATRSPGQDAKIEQMNREG